MRKFDTYSAADSMARLVSENHRALLVMSRFGLGLGFGNKTIQEVCEEQGVDTTTFLTVVNILLNEETGPAVPENISLTALVDYLHNSHEYFLGFRLPGIRKQLLHILCAEEPLSKAIVSYFDGYAEEVRKHMQYEEAFVFPYVHKLLWGEDTAGYNIEMFEKQHNQVEARLTEFKNIIIRFYPARNTHEMNDVLFDIFNCEYDLASHNAVEDHVFIPAIVALEAKNRKK
jgi:Regulator of cell morphogenesis and NO signaling